jgi:3',5'-nucleoside bisphosphate phosphatase
MILNRLYMRPLILSAYLICLFFYCLGQSKEITGIPYIPGYQSSKCDLHIYTLFPDGTVWPMDRIEGALRENMDATEIIGHTKYKPLSKKMVAVQNRSFEIEEPLLKSLHIILIKDSWSTHNIPPDHVYALFIKNANHLKSEDVTDQMGEAYDQGAFINWNHAVWKEHICLLQINMIHGYFNHSKF